MFGFDELFELEEQQDFDDLERDLEELDFPLYEEDGA